MTNEPIVRYCISPYFPRLSSLPQPIMNHSFCVLAYSVSITCVNVIDLSAGLLMLMAVVLCFIGPWKFSREHWIYGIYAAGFYLFLLLFPSDGTFPLQSLSRLVLEIFPAFIVLAAIGKYRQFNLYYLTLSGAMLCFMLLQFLTGYWIV